MVDKNTLERLNKFQAGEFFITSLYLNVDGRQLKKRDYEIKLKALIKNRKQDMEGLGLNQTVQQSIHADLDRLLNFVTLEFNGKKAKSLAIYSCSGMNLWETYQLPQTVHSRLVLSKQPYIQPLEALLNANKQYFTIISNRKKTRFFEYYMGELVEQSQILDEVPGQTKMAGWYGLAERRIERHIEDLVHRHFKHVSESAFQYFQKEKPDFVIIGGNKKIIPELERHLHSTIRDKIIAEINIDVDTTAAEFLEKIEKVVQDFEIQEQKQLLEQLFEESQSGGLGVTGMKATLKALWHGQVSALFVTEDYSQPGYYCPNCWYLSNNEETCLNDKIPMKRTHDVVEDAIETAMLQNCEVIRIRNKDELKEVEHIGALLRFSF